MIIKIPCWEDELLFQNLAIEHGLFYEELDEGNYAEVCPACDDYEFWHNGHCSHCDFSL